MQLQRVGELALLGRERLGRPNLLDAIVIDADGHGHNRGRASAHPDARRLLVHLSAELLLRCLQEVRPIALELEGEQIVGGEPVDQLGAPRANPQAIRMRPRNVPEERRADAFAPRAKRRRDEREVIVLQEHRRIARVELLVDRRREPFVDLAVGRPLLAAEARAHVDDMAERPQPLVGKAAVVRGKRRLLEPQPAQRIRGMFRRHQHLVGIVDDQAIGGARPVRNPGAAALAHQRVERHGDAAGCRRPRDAAIVAADVQIRLAVRDDEQRTTGARLLLAGARQAAPEEHRSDQLVDRDERDEQRLQLRSPTGKFRGDNRGQADGDARL